MSNILRFSEVSHSVDILSYQSRRRNGPRPEMLGTQLRGINGRVQLEGDDLVSPKCPVSGMIESGSVSFRNEHGVGKSARIHTRAAESDLGTVSGGRGEHSVEVVVAVWQLLICYGTTHRITEAEYFDFYSVTFRETSCKSYAVVGAFGAVRGSLQYDEDFHWSDS